MEVQKDLVDVVYTLKQMVCVKGLKKCGAQIAKPLKKLFTMWQS